MTETDKASPSLDDLRIKIGAVAHVQAALRRSLIDEIMADVERILLVARASAAANEKH